MKEIRKIIKEVLGVYMPLNDMAERYANKVFEIIMKESDGGKKPLTFHSKGLNLSEYTNQSDRENSEINYVEIDIIPIYKKNDTRVNKITGALDSEKVKNDKAVFGAYINLFVINWDGKEILTLQIKEVLTHELFHAFRIIKKNKKTPYNDVLNLSKREMSFYNAESTNETLKEFMKIFYLGLSEEISARVHEAFTKMDNLKLNFKNASSDEIIKELNNKIPVFKDLLRIQRFDVNDVLNIPQEVKNNFVEKFNEILKKNGYKNIIKNPDEFFKYWISRAKNESLKARHKIISQALNLFSNKTISEYNEKEYNKQFAEEIMPNINQTSMGIIYEYFYNSYDEYINDLFVEELKKYGSV